jgi:hypothetical protein
MINTKMIGVLSLIVMVAAVEAADDQVEYGRRYRTKKRHLRKGTNIISTTSITATAATATTDLTEDVAFWTRQLVYSMPPTYPVPAPTPTVQVTTNPPVPDTIDFTDPPVPDTIDTYQPSGGGGTVEAPKTTEPVLTDPPISSSTGPPAPAPLTPFPTETTDGSFKTQSPTIVGFSRPPFNSNPPVEFISNTPEAVSSDPPVSVSTTVKDFYCGTNWEDAVTSCNRPCPSGECPGEQTCFADTGCMANIEYDSMVTPAPTVVMASETTLTPTATGTTVSSSSPPPAPPIDEVLENTIDLSALKTLLESVGVLDDLKSLGPFTVFGKFHPLYSCMRRCEADNASHHLSYISLSLLRSSNTYVQPQTTMLLTHSFQCYLMDYLIQK